MKNLVFTGWGWLMVALLVVTDIGNTYLLPGQMQVVFDNKNWWLGPLDNILVLGIIVLGFTLVLLPLVNNAEVYYDNMFIFLVLSYGVFNSFASCMIWWGVEINGGEILFTVLLLLAVKAAVIFLVHTLKDKVFVKFADNLA